MGVVEVTDCIKVIGGKIAHIGTVTEGSISVGDTATAEIDMVKRLGTSRNHSGLLIFFRRHSGLFSEHTLNRPVLT